MKPYLIDSNGFIKNRGREGETLFHRARELGVEHESDEVDVVESAMKDLGWVLLEDPDPAFRKPKWDGEKWIDGNPYTQAELDERFENRKQEAIRRIQDQATQKIIDIHGGVAALIGHFQKRLDANAQKSLSPATTRTDSTTPHLDEWMTEQGLDPKSTDARDSAADQILTAEASDAFREAKLERFRKKAIDGIGSASDQAQIDSAIATWKIDIGTV